MRLFLTTRAVDFEIAVRDRAPERRADVPWLVFVRVGRRRWERARYVTDMQRRMGSAIDRLDLRKPYVREVAEHDARSRARHDAEMTRLAGLLVDLMS